jgi:ABC-2 type transport system ATP-binding protein
MIRMRDVTFRYGGGSAVLQAVDLSIHAGLTLLLGPNGCGKSTFLKLAAGVERPDSGVAEIQGHDLWRNEVEARRWLAYVPEQPDLTPYASILDVIRLVCRLRSEPFESGREVLAQAGLAAVARRSIRELSMGQRRRAVLAAAWIGSPRVVLLDEPLESMDRIIREVILCWIDRLLNQKAAVVIATHEIEPFVEKAARAITMTDGRCTVYEPLPEGEVRFNVLERLSRAVEMDSASAR